MKAWLALILLVAPSAGLAAGDCAAIDPELVECAAPEAPRVTGLTAGHVVVRITVGTDGIVHSVRIESSSGHPAWRRAVLDAVRYWRYAPSDAVRSKVVPLDLALD
jgi:TonB family protein